MLNLLGFVIQSEAERKEEQDNFNKLYEQYQYVERMVDNCLTVITEKDEEIKNLETIIQRYKEKLRDRKQEELDEQTKS